MGDETEKKFLGFLNRDEFPCDYEKQLLQTQDKRIVGVLEGKLIPPYELEIQPSSTCNLKCKHCFGRDYHRLPNTLGEKEMDILGKRVDEFKENGFGIEVVKFCGTTGEPLMNPVILYGIDLFKKLGKKVIVFTNGLFLGNSSGTKSYYDAVLNADKVNVSLDAGSERTFTELKGRPGFEQTVSGLRKMLGARTGNLPYVVVSYVIGKQNYSDILQTTKMVKEMSADEIRFRIDFTDVQRMKELSDIVINSLEQAKSFEDDAFKVDSVYSNEEIKTGGDVFCAQARKCFNHHFWACIGPDCNLYTCGHRTYAEVQSFGSLLENPFPDLWTSKKRQDQISHLPDNYCRVCSPSSTRRNDFMTFLSSVKPDRAKELVLGYKNQTQT